MTYPEQSSEWFVAIRLDACRTRDEIIKARSSWAAGWLYRYLHPHIEVLSVRPATREASGKSGA